ncbi:hypothetical protein F0562_020398 [Nyssa sinensis]|uniref:Peptidase C14 caspase domain-containing protein n=1 Tax=Nyssa sinensis TaxID=561372 RepID=A0A5J5BSD6_9ASTE|nr:hypothetical protein F0562_020398 [Nyssa sinensis]
MAPTVGCNFWKEIIRCERTEQSSQDNGDRVGSLAMHLKRKLSGIGSSIAASPKPAASKLNPWSSNPGHPRKRAFLCGVSYKEFKFKLKGVTTDVKCMKSLLLDQFNFPSESVLVLTEEGSHDGIPTKANMQKALKWLVEDCQSGDSLVFYFSGHGLRQPDFDEDELDGFDETLCPVDFKTHGMILDNEINATIVRPLKQGVKLHAIIDACHSGTVLDLEHVYNRIQQRWVDNKPPSGAYKGTSGGLAICISACADDQMAADTNALTGKEMAGALTTLFIQAIKETPRITYGELLCELQKKIEDAKITGCLNVGILDKMFRRRLLQEAQLSSSEEFDVNDKILEL